MTKEYELTTKQVKQIAKEAYIYSFPMVVNYKTMYMYAVNPESPEYKGGFNVLGCEARGFTPEDRAVVTPNSDTSYCLGWLDLRAEPFVITVPEPVRAAGTLLRSDLEAGRYCQGWIVEHLKIGRPTSNLLLPACQP